MAGDEDELAAILAHEIQHIVAKDPLKAIKSQRMKALGTFTAGEAMGSGNQVVGILQDSVMDISGTLLQKGYSRGQEKDADLDALELLAATGYEPAALLSMLQKVKAVEKKKAKAFSAHPSAAKRIAYVSGGIGKGRRRATAARAARFTRVLPPLTLKRFWLSTALIFACTFALGSILPLLFEKKIYDVKARLFSLRPRRPIVLVEIDQESIDFYSKNFQSSLALAAQPLRPGDRFPAAAGVKAVALDMLFSEPSLYGGEDDWLAASMSKSGRVFLPLFFSDKREAPRSLERLPCRRRRCFRGCRPRKAKVPQPVAPIHGAMRGGGNAQAEAGQRQHLSPPEAFLSAAAAASTRRSRWPWPCSPSRDCRWPRSRSPPTAA